MASEATARKKAAKPPRTTAQKFRFWRNVGYACKGVEFLSPLVPFSVMLGLNWENWFPKDAGTGWSIGLGFGMLIVSTLLAVWQIVKKDDLMKEKLSFLFSVCVVFVLFGFSFKLLSSIMSEMGDMFLYVGCGLLGGAMSDQADRIAFKPRREFYRKLIEENGLSKVSARKQEDIEQAKREGEERKKERAYHPVD